MATISLVMAAASSSLAALSWETDLDKGLEAARTGNRTVMVEFTGSDWCPPCKYLRGTILDSPEFSGYAEAEKLVLVELDYPRDPKKISPELMNKREEIMRRYNVTGFPTVLLMDGSGAPHAKILGPTKTADQYLEKLKEAQSLKNSVNGEIGAARKFSGPERAQALVKALQKMPPELQGYHKEIIAEIIAADPEDRLGFGKKEREARMMAEQKKMLDLFFGAWRGKLKGDGIRQGREEAQKILASPDLLPPVRLKLNKFISDGYVMERDLPKSLEYLKAARDADPGSRESQRMELWIEEMEKTIAGGK